MRLHLISKTTRGVTYWYAETRIYDYSTGRQRIIRRQYPLKVKGKAKRRQAEDALRRLEARMGAQLDRPRLTVAEWREEYLAAVHDGLRPKTRQIYEFWTGLFSARFGFEEVQSITPKTIDAWRASLAVQYAPASVNIALRSVRTWFKMAVARGYLAASPMATVRMTRVPARTFPPFLTPDQFRAVLDAGAPDARHRVAYALAMYAGLRRGEAVNLTWRDVSFERREIRVVSRGAGRETKTGKARTVPLYAALSQELAQLDRASEYVLGLRPRSPADPSALSHAWHRLVAAAREQHPDIPPVTYHGLRHSFATWLSGTAGLNLKLLQAVMGHENIQTTMIYAHTQPDVAVAQALLVEP